ncbi:hypothetical protein H8Z72_22645 (plasmid) [Xanthomonas citri pv. citri]|uniref:hypothetical protein n=1 Tax=Xanthomonas citri TaxID=346 RepID=UPI0019346FCA|nr:hypothetical protein [Xanthomonas citri]QRD62670.1 hypothetical protein H8Z74_23540 [Xanthomonas citri pv. citri]QRD67205.1 hypothetical protein H8Z73_22520 [Xanthomonas citri pv. citri]QRD71750.1 hypothetical protein H8Z72_22645 [Xanthomonas citri pv. citri]
MSWECIPLHRQAFRDCVAAVSATNPLLIEVVAAEDVLVVELLADADGGAREAIVDQLEHLAAQHVSCLRVCSPQVLSARERQGLLARARRI